MDDSLPNCAFCFFGIFLSFSEVYHKDFPMSEYQYYEWQKLESPLTMNEQDAVEALSSHIEVSAMQASVSYNWSSFKYDPLIVLAKYFDFDASRLRLFCRKISGRLLQR